MEKNVPTEGASAELASRLGIKPPESEPVSGAVKEPESQPDANGVESKKEDDGAVKPPKGGNVKKPEPITLDNLEAIKESHPELLDFAKQLQGDYTKKTTELAHVRNRADAYDDLTNDPRFVLFARDTYGIEINPELIKDMPSQKNSDKQSEDNIIAGIDMDDVTVDDDVKALAKMVQSQSATIEQLTGQLATKQNNDELSGLEEEFPDIRERMAELLPLMRSKNMSVRGAYLEKFGKDIIEKRAQAIVDKKLADAEAEKIAKSDNTILPNTGTGTGEQLPTNTAGVKSIRDAIKASIQEIAAG